MITANHMLNWTEVCNMFVRIWFRCHVGHCYLYKCIRTVNFLFWLFDALFARHDKTARFLVRPQLPRTHRIFKINCFRSICIKLLKTRRLLYNIQCSLLNLNFRRPTKFVLIMRCSNYKYALNIKCKYNGLSRDHNQLSELTGFLN